MMCDWKLRLVSKTSDWPGFTATTLLVGLACALLTLSSGVVFAETRQVMVQDSDKGQSEAQQLKFWAAEDTRWLRTLSAAEYALGRQALASAKSDSSLNRLRGMINAIPGTVAADSMVSTRLVENRLRDRWLARGYLAASVTAEGDTLKVQVGALWTIGLWDLGGADFPGRERLLETWLPRSGDVFRSANVEQGIDRVLVGTGEVGFPFARWVTRELKLHPDKNQVDIKASLLPGKAAFIGPITSDLTEPRARSFLARSTGLRPGELFQHSDLDRAVDRLLARDLYTQVGTPRLYLTAAVDTVGVHFPVVARRKVNRLQVVLGLSRREDEIGRAHV